MSLTSTTTRNSYVGTASTATYAYSFKIFAATDLDVKIENLSGVVTSLSYPSGYSVSGVGSVGGGNITLTAGNLATNFKLVIKRARPYTQTTSIKNETTYYAKTHEDTFDKITMLIQQLKEVTDRSVQLAPTTAGFDATLPTILSANKTLVIGPTGTSLALGPTPDELADASAAVAAAQLAATQAGNSATAAGISATNANAALTAALLAQSGANTAKVQAEAARDAAIAAAASFNGFVDGGPLTLMSGANANTGDDFDEAQFRAVDFVVWATGTSVRSRFEFSVVWNGSAWILGTRGELHLLNVAYLDFTIATPATGNVNISNTSGVTLNVSWKKLLYPL